MKAWKILIAWMLVFVLVLSMVACDSGNTTDDDEDDDDGKTTTTDGGQGVQTTAPITAPINVVELEELAKEFLKNQDKLTVTVTSVSKMYFMDGYELHSTIVQEQMLNGGNVKLVVDTKHDLHEVATGATEPFSDSKSTTTQIGTVFYVWEEVDGEGFGLKITAEQEEIDEVNEAFGAEVEQLYSLAHFETVSATENPDGTTTYVCSGIKASASEIYEELFATMTSTMGTEASFDMAKDSFRYSVTLDQDNHITTATLTFDIDVDAVVDGQTVPMQGEFAFEFDYEYTAEEIIAPTTDSSWQSMTWDELMGAMAA